MPLKVVFMGTPDFAAEALKAIAADDGFDVICAYSQPPRPAGRGKKERKNPVHELAESLGIEVRTPLSLKGEDEQAAFAALGADIAVVAAYGLILPKAVLDAPRLGCINIHGSLLPRWRGAAPIQRAIMAGDAETGITIMQMDVGLDTGPMLTVKTLPITDDTTAASLHDELADLGATMIVEALHGLAAGTLSPTPQPEDGVTYASKIDKAEAAIDWTRPAQDLSRHICGLSPFPGAWFDHDGQRIKVLMARAVAGSGAPGTVLDEDLTVACGEGAVQLTRLQRPGKGPMDAGDFLRGYPLAKGTAL